MTTAVLAGRITWRGAARTAERAAVALGRTRPEPALPGALDALSRHATLDTAGDAARLTAYQHLVGETATDVLPAGFLHVLGFPLSTTVMTDPAFPLPMLGMVHVANRAEVLAPVRLGTPVDVAVRPSLLTPHRRGTTVEIVTEIAVGGAAVYRGTSVYLAKGTWFFGPPAEQDGAAAPGAMPGAVGASDAAERPAFVRPAPTARWKFTPSDNRAYTAVAGDRNPIHSSALAARAFGFPRRILHGMHGAARALALVPGRGETYAWSVEFGTPILVPGGADVAVRASTGGGEVVAWNREGRPHLTVVVTSGG